jgi:hypothetical protein
MTLSHPGQLNLFHLVCKVNAKEYFVCFNAVWIDNPYYVDCSLPALKITKKGALDSQPQVIKFTSCLPMVGGSLRLPQPLKLVAMI